MATGIFWRTPYSTISDRLRVPAAWLAGLLVACAARADTIRTYAYDSQGRVTRIECGGWSVSYAYDYQGRLYSRTEDGGNGARKQLYSGAQVVAEYGAGGKRYLCGPGIDNVLGFHDGAARYLHRDGLGSVTLATDGSNEVLERVSYDAFGMPTFRDAEYGPAESATGNRQLFTGREWEGELGLYNYRARFYAPEAGRFVSPDPIGVSGGLNLYGYCGNNPVNLTDPSGLGPAEDARAAAVGTLTPGSEGARENCLAKALGRTGELKGGDRTTEDPWPEETVIRNAGGREVDGPCECQDGEYAVKLYEFAFRDADWMPYQFHTAYQNPDGTWSSKDGKSGLFTYADPDAHALQVYRDFFPYEDSCWCVPETVKDENTCEQ